MATTATRGRIVPVGRAVRPVLALRSLVVTPGPVGCDDLRGIQGGRTGQAFTVW